jgi:site-specific DNA recombinase
MKTAIGYIRVSGEGQIDNTSLESQREAIKKYAEDHDWKLSKIYADEGKSGKQMVTRKALLQLLKDASQGKFKVMICYDLDRFGRDVRDILNNRYELEKYGVEEHFVTSPEDSNFIKNIKAAVAEEEREKIKARTMSGKLHLLNKGIPAIGRLPFNRKYNKETEKWSFVDEERNEYIKWAAQRYLDGKSLKKIADELSTKGFKITSVHLTRVLGQKCGSKIDFNVKGQTFSMDMPKILDERTIKAIRKKLDFNKKNNRRDVRKYVLSGFLRCLHCGSSLSGQSPHGCNAKYYVHSYKNDVCKSFRTVPLDMIERAIFRTLFSNIYDEPSFDKAIRESLPDTEMVDSLKKSISDNENELKRIDSKLEKLVDAVMDGTLRNVTIQKKEDSLYKLMDSINEELARDKERLRFLPDPDEVKKDARIIRLGLLDYFGSMERLQAMSFDEKRKLLHWLFDGKDKSGKPWGVYVWKIDKGEFGFYIRASLIDGPLAVKGDDIHYSFSEPDEISNFEDDDIPLDDKPLKRDKVDLSHLRFDILPIPLNFMSPWKRKIWEERIKTGEIKTKNLSIEKGYEKC